jgi:DNA polymerase III epsilon subunit-like protein/ADP-ribose pyrophosphatase YjhB (NUDIX family)
VSTWDGPLGVFDLETTGVDTDTARIVSACVAVLDPEGAVTARWDWLVDPGIEVPDGASAVHGITTERAREEGRAAETAIAEIAQTLRVLFAQGVPVTAYNAPYDLTLLDRECRRHGIEPLQDPQPVVDPLVIDKAVDRYRKGKRTLEVTAEFYGVELDGAHDAGADAICTGRVAQAMARAYPEELGVSAVDLHGRQEIWYVEQAQNFEEYVRTKPGREGYTADRSWPVRPVDHPNTFVDTQPLPPLPPQPGRVPIVDFSEFDRRRLAPPATSLSEDLRRAPDVPLTALVETITVVEETVIVEPEPEPEPASAAAGQPGTTTVLRVAAAIVTDPAGRCLVVRKRGTEQFMQAGGKVEPGESALEALTRELREELDLELDPDQAEYLGIFRAPAANESDTLVSAAVFAVATGDGLQPHGEIEELRWIASLDTDLPLAPLTRDELLPLWEQRRTSTDGALF